jgi:predicted PurR-regulated permease PerM
LPNRSWISVPGVPLALCVLIVAVLYWARALFEPIALAILLTFLLTPVVTSLQRRIGRVAAIAVTTLVVATATGVGGYLLTRQLTHLIEDLPTYRTNIRAKIRDVRGLGSAKTLQTLQDTINSVGAELAPAEPRARAAAPVVIVDQGGTALLNIPSYLPAIAAMLGQVALVGVLVIFMLFERQDLRSRLIQLLGHGHLATTTKALDEAAERVSRYLLMQGAVNLIYGTAVAIGLSVIGAPQPLLWAVLGALLRYVPYAGPAMAALGPTLMSVAALPGWQQPLEVALMFLVVEILTNMVLETHLFAGAAGVSQVALIVAVAFWTWLWGATGLFMATPLTVCVIVIGRHVPGFELLSTLLSDQPNASPDATFYQRLLARDYGEAADILETEVAAQGPESVFDTLLIPALVYAERDRTEERLTTEEEVNVMDGVRDLMADRLPASADPDRTIPTPRVSALRVLGYPVNGDSDTLALEMLRAALIMTPVDLEIAPPTLLSSELITMMRSADFGLLCLVDLPPSSASKCRYLVRKLRQALPDLRVVVGRFAPPSMADPDSSPITGAGAALVTPSVTELATYLAQLATTTVAAASVEAADPAPA